MCLYSIRLHSQTAVQHKPLSAALSYMRCKHFCGSFVLLLFCRPHCKPQKSPPKFRRSSRLSSKTIFSICKFQPMRFQFQVCCREGRANCPHRRLPLCQSHCRQCRIYRSSCVPAYETGIFQVFLNHLKISTLSLLVLITASIM